MHCHSDGQYWPQKSTRKRKKEDVTRHGAEGFNRKERKERRENREGSDCPDLNRSARSERSGGIWDHETHEPHENWAWKWMAAKRHKEAQKGGRDQAGRGGF